MNFKQENKSFTDVNLPNGFFKFKFQFNFFRLLHPLLIDNPPLAYKKKKNWHLKKNLSYIVRKSIEIVKMLSTEDEWTTEEEIQVCYKF